MRKVKSTKYITKVSNMFYFIQKENSAYILSGGALIGFGSFGCIYHPTILPVCFTFPIRE